MAHDAGDGRRLGALQLLAPFAAVLAIASVLGRGVAPSAVGTVSWADALLLLDGFVAQIVAVTSTGMCVALLVAAALAPRSAGLRIALVTLGALALLVALSAAGVARVPPPALVLVTASAASASFLAALTGARRLPELALGLAGLGAMVRLVAVQLSARSPTAAATLAVLTVAIELAIVAVAAAFLLRARRRGVVALVLTGVVAAASAWIVVAQPDGGALVVARHALERLAPRPHPFGAAVVPVVLATCGVALAIGLAVARRADPAIVGAVGLVVLVRTHADVPLLGIALTVAALGLFLARAGALGTDPRGDSPRARGTSPHPPPAGAEPRASALQHDVPSGN